MARPVRPSTIAIRDGVGARARELGFERKSGRLYWREDERVTEWIHFGIRPDETFTETYGIFDKDLRAYVDRYVSPEMHVGPASSVHPAHRVASALPHAKWLFGQAYDAWRDARSFSAIRRQLVCLRLTGAKVTA